MKKILSALLLLSMILALVAAMGINTSAKEGDVLYNVNFKGDDKFSPETFACLNGDDVITAVPSEDGSSITATYREDASVGRAFWGGAIKGFTYGEGKQYTITMKMAVGYTDNDGKISSSNAGVYINMLNSTDADYILNQGYKALVGYYGCPNIRHTLSYGAGGKSVGALISKDVYITDAKYLSTVDAEGFVDLAFAVDGKNVKVYINNVYLDEFDAFNEGLLEKAGNLGFVIYLYNSGASVTVKDAKIYEGITIKNATYPDYYVDGAKVTNYEASKTGDLLFTADFTRRDTGFYARFIASNDNLYTATVDSANPGHIKIESVGSKAGNAYYGGIIGGLEVNSDTEYTYDVKIKTAAQNAGFCFAVPTIHTFINSIALNGNFQTGSIATQHGSTKVLNQVKELASNGYASVSNMAVDADGFASLRAELNGYEFTAYYLNTEGNWELYTKIDMTHTTKNDGSAEYVHDTGFQLCVGFYLYNKGLVAEYKDINVYKGLLITDSVTPPATDGPSESFAVTNEAEFLAMNPAGSYYLANDITVTQSYDKLFTGVFDGNGKTVTVSEPMFLEFCGTGMNLTLQGDIVADHAKDNGYWARGAFACMASGDEVVTIYNITNNANVTGFLEEDTATYAGLLGHAYTGGIIGAFDNQSVGTAASFQIINCTNNGNVKGYHCTGGITGILYLNDSAYIGEQFVKVTNATNNGNIEGVNTYTGGIVGRIYYCVDATFTGCINNGNITGYSNTGGIIGHTTNTSLIMRFCQNSGFISNYSKDGETPYAGGLLGYGQGTKNADLSAANGKYANIIEYCINTGDVTGDCRSGGISGSTGANGAYGISHTRYCINTGNITNKGLGTSAAANAVGGIQGYGYGSGTKEYTFITNCINTGNIVAMGTEKGVAAYFLGHTSSKYAVVKDNTALGTLTSAAGNTYALCWNNAAEFAPENITGNSLPAGNTYAHTYENKIVDKVYEVGATDEATLASGQIIYEINEAYKAAAGATEDVFYMIAGTFAPTLEAAEDGSNTIVKNADGTYSNPGKVTDPVTPPETGEQTYVYGDANGDGAVNGRDVILLRKYMADFDYDTGVSSVEVHSGADANGDSVINGRDVLLLRRYMAEYDYDTGSSTVILGPQ